MIAVQVGFIDLRLDAGAAGNQWEFRTGRVSRLLSAAVLSAFVSPLYIVVHVRPKLLQLIPKRVEAHLHSPVVEIPRNGSILGGIIDIGNGNRGCIASKFGGVECVRAGVFSGDENTADGIAEAVPERALPNRK